MPEAEQELELEQGDVEVELGTMHYTACGPAGGPVAVLLHGFTMGSFEYARLSRALARAGLRAVAPDFLGRGRSVLRELRPHTKKYMVAQVEQFLVALGPWSPSNNQRHPQDPHITPLDLSLVGHSMGGAVAGAVAAAFPGRVERVVLMSPAGLPMPVSLGVRATAWPVVGPLLFWMTARKALLSSVAQDAANGDSCPGMQEIRDEKAWAMDHTPLFLEATLSILQHLGMAAGCFASDYAALGAGPAGGMPPVLQLWGDRDAVCGADEAVPRMRELMPGAVFRVLEGVGHVPNYEAPELTHSAIVEFLAPLVQQQVN
eukprot:m51a1_g7990 hypothetical protein (317) ;mRNA; r:97926-99409